MIRQEAKYRDTELIILIATFKQVNDSKPHLTLNVSSRGDLAWPNLDSFLELVKQFKQKEKEKISHFMFISSSRSSTKLLLQLHQWLTDLLEACQFVISEVDILQYDQDAELIELVVPRLEAFAK